MKKGKKEKFFTVFNFNDQTGYEKKNLRLIPHFTRYIFAHIYYTYDDNKEEDREAVK